MGESTYVIQEEDNERLAKLLAQKNNDNEYSRRGTEIVRLGNSEYEGLSSS